MSCCLGAMAILAGLLLGGTAPVLANEQVIRLVTDGTTGRFRFEPALVLASPGDRVRFVPESRLHAIKSIAGMLPAGAESWRGRMGEPLTLRLDKPGIYGVKCPAHYSLGMVALIVVGPDPANWAQSRAVRHPAAAAEAMAALFGQAACKLGPKFAGDCVQSLTE